MDVRLKASYKSMSYIEPVYDSYWDEGREEFIHSDFVVGYQVVSDTGTILGSGESREEALASAHECNLLFA